jgi:hypothetical protein
MTRPLIVATHALLGTAYLTGCGVVCRGPACADEWDVGRALAIPGAPDRPEGGDAVEAAALAWMGTDVEGADWAVAAGDGEVLIGTPGSSEVWPMAADASGSLAGRPWTDGTSFGFGAAIAREDTATWVGNPEAHLATGAVYRYPPGATDPDLEIQGASPGDRFGERLWTCGDLDGDGIGEILVAAPWFAPPPGFPLADPTVVPPLAGAATLLLSTELAADPDRPLWELGRLWWGAGSGDALASGATCERDLDGDAIPDVALGAPYEGAGDDGAIYLVSGATLPASGPIDAMAPARLPGTRAVVGAEGPQSESERRGGWVGLDLATIANRTGQVLLVVGAPGWHDGAGAVWLVDAVGPLQVVARFEADAAAAGNHVGRFVAHGDTDGDGREDLLIGAPDWKEGRNGYDAGRAFALYGGPAWSGVIPLAADTTWTATQPFARVGRGLSAADLDGDGADELLLPTRTAILP